MATKRERVRYDGPDEVHKAVVARRILRAFSEGDGWRFT